MIKFKNSSSNKTIASLILGVLVLTLTVTSQVAADNVSILAAEFQHRNADVWTVRVTLKHADSGWDHYADNWRVVDSNGNVLGDRVLLHPHVDEQPFTRSLSGVTLPNDITTIYVEAHDKVHGWTPTRLKVDLSKASNGRLKVEATSKPGS